MTDTSSRMLRLLTLLQSGRARGGPELAERLAVTERTIRRDVDRLRELGYRITAGRGPHGGYRLDAGAALPPLLFDDDQAVALAVALRTVPGADVADGAARALTTVRQVLPPRLRRRVDALRVEPVADPAPPAVAPGVLAAIGEAMRERQELRFDYAVDGRADRRRAQPHHLVTRNGHWYLVAWDRDRDDWRIFRTDRIAPRTPNGPRFAPRAVPGADVAAFVRARFKGADRADAWPCQGRAVLHAPATALAPFVTDGVIDDLGPDRCRVALGAWSWTALAAAYGRFDADIAHVEPPALADAFARVAARFATAARCGGP